MLETPELEVFFTESVTRKKRQIQLNVNLGKRAGVSTKPMGHIHNFFSSFQARASKVLTVKSRVLTRVTI